MDAEVNNFTPLFDEFAYVWGAMAIMAMVLMIYLGLVPAKQKSDLLKGTKKIALILFGLLTFLLLISMVFMVYGLFFNEFPSLIVSIIIFLISLLIGVFTVVRWYYLQVGTIETWDLLIRLKNKSNQK